VFEDRVLRRMFGLRRDEMMGGWEGGGNFIMRTLEICTLCQV
jgi:hypothetical protein